VASYYRREYGAHPGVRGLFYAIGTWNMYARRLIDFQRHHPEAIDIVSIDELVAGNGSLSDLLRARGFPVTGDHGIRDVLRTEWGGSPGWVGRGLPVWEAVFRTRVERERKVYFDSSTHVRALAALSR
jgi:hypothetical protein